MMYQPKQLLIPSLSSQEESVLKIYNTTLTNRDRVDFLKKTIKEQRQIIRELVEREIRHQKLFSSLVLTWRSFLSRSLRIESIVRKKGLLENKYLMFLIIFCKIVLQDQQSKQKYKLYYCYCNIIKIKLLKKLDVNLQKRIIVWHQQERKEKKILLGRRLIPGLLKLKCHYLLTEFDIKITSKIYNIFNCLMHNTLFQNNQNNIFQRPPPSSNWSVPNPEPPIQGLGNKSVKGSYRAIFKSVQSTGHDGNKCMSTSIMSQPEYNGYTLSMVRLEDYYLIRTHQIEEKHKHLVGKAINSNLFNRRLIEAVNTQSLPIPIFYKQSNWGNNNTTSFGQRENKPQNYFQSQNAPHSNNNPFLKQTDNLFNNQTQDKGQNIFQATSANNIFTPIQKPNQTPVWQSQQNNQPQNQPILGQLAQSHIVIGSSQQSQPIQPPQSVFNSPAQPVQPMQGQQLGLFSNQPVQSNQGNPFAQQQQLQTQIQQQPQILQGTPYQLQPQQAIIPQFTQNYPQLPINPLFSLAFNEEAFCQILQAQIKNYQNVSSQLTEQIQEFERLKAIENETRIQQERLFNAEAEKRRLEREKRNREIDRCDWKAQIKPQPKKPDQRVQQYQKTKIFQTPPRMNQTNEKRISHIELYYPESQNKIRTTLEIDNTNPQFKTQLLLKINELGFFNNDKSYLEKSEIEQDENQDPQTSCYLLRAISTFRPILTKQGYITFPDINQMTLSQLKDVKEFVIANEYGSLKWESPTNLMYLNLDKIIEIKETYVSVYDYSQINEYMKPKEGIKLNKPCIVTLQTHQIQLTEQQLREQCQQQGAEFLGINEQKKEFSFRVQHFSIYQFLHDDPEPNQAQNTQIPQEPIKPQSENQSQLIQLELQNERKKGFNEQLKDIYPLPIKFANQKIDKINYNRGTNIPQLQEIEICLPNKDMIGIDYSFFTQLLIVQEEQDLFEKQQEENQQNHQFQNNLSVKFVQSLLNLNKRVRKIPGEKKLFMERLQYFNILFGNPAITLKDAVELLEIHQDQLQIENLYEIQQSNFYQIGLSLIMYLEEIVKKRNCKEENFNYQQYVINQIKNDSTMNKQVKQSNIFSFISVQPDKQVRLPFQSDDWISCILDWKVNGEYYGNQFSKEWWVSLGNLLDQFQIQSSELAALVYFINSKLQKSYDRIYEYLNKNHDEMSFLLESILIQNDQANQLIHKRIMINKIAFLVENNEDEVFIHLILQYCNRKLFNDEECRRLKNQILRMQNSLQYKTQFKFQDQDQYLQKLVDQQNYLEVGRYLLNSNIEGLTDYYKYLFEYAIPILIIFGEKEQLHQFLILIKGKKWKLEERQNQICDLGYIYCHKAPYDESKFKEFNAKNVYEYQALKLLEEYQFM